MKVCVVGLGYIGLPTAFSLADNGVDVIGVDKSRHVLDTLKNGQMTFKEDGMAQLFERVLAGGNLTLETTPQPCEIYIVAVPTPYMKISKQIDASYVVNAVKEVIEIAPKGAIIAVESTISPGTIDKYVRPLFEDSRYELGKDIHVAHVPETIIPGNMLYELKHNNRIIGADCPQVAEKLKQTYATFCRGEIVITDIKTAEMAKVVQNTFRDINIAFANELAKMCNRAQMDVYEIIRVANLHPRVNILSPGPGVGGHCISVDPWFLVGDYPDIVNIIRQARLINDEMPEYVLRRISRIMSENGITSLSRVGFYGLTYKEDVDDTRESPTLQIMECMKEHAAFGAKFYDPMLDEKIVENQYMDFDEFIGDIDMLVVMVGHSHIKQNVDKISNLIVYDTRNCIDNPNIYKL